jgi:hypothetical protein
VGGVTRQGKISTVTMRNGFTVKKQAAELSCSSLRLAPVVNLMSLKVKTEGFCGISFPAEINMDLQIKLFSGLDRGNHVIVITRGLVDLEGLRQIFRNIVDTTRSLLDCRVLVDLQDATYCLEPGDIHDFAVHLRPEFWPPTNRVALVSVPEPQDYRQLCLLSTFLSNRRIRNAVFQDTKSALSWLVETN